MVSQGDLSLDFNASDIKIGREISRFKASTVYGIQLCGQIYVMKLYHNNGDPEYTPKGRDLNRFRCELNAYLNLHKSGVCERGYVACFHGYINQLDPLAFDPPLQGFADDKYHTEAIIIEYLPNAEKLNCVNYSEDLFHYVIDGIKQIHAAFVHHHDIYQRNMLAVDVKRIVWIDFDVAITFRDFGSRPMEYCQYEVDLVEDFGKLLKEHQRQGLPPNTKFY